MIVREGKREERKREEGKGERDATDLRSLERVPSRLPWVGNDDPLEQAGSILVSELRNAKAMTQRVSFVSSLSCLDSLPLDSQLDLTL